MYTIFCTHEQVIRAYNLGAPIEVLSNYAEFKGLPFVRCKDGNMRPCELKTAEWMIGWLEDQGFYFRLNTSWCSVEIGYNCILELINTCRRDSTLAAIDAALNYLEQHKK